MRGIPLRCPYHLYTKKNKSVSCFFLLTNLLYEEVTNGLTKGTTVYSYDQFSNLVSDKSLFVEVKL